MTKWKRDFHKVVCWGWLLFCVLIRIFSLASRVGLCHRSYSFPLHTDKWTNPNRLRARAHATNIQYYEIWKSEVERPTLFVSSQKLAHIPTIRIVAIHFFSFCANFIFVADAKTALNLFHKFFFPISPTRSFPKCFSQSLKFLWRDKMALAPDFNGSNVFWFLRNDGEQKMKQPKGKKKQFIVSKVVSVSLCLFLCVERVFIGYYRGGIRVSHFFSVQLNIWLIFVWQCFIYRFSARALLSLQRWCCVFGERVRENVIGDGGVGTRFILPFSFLAFCHSQLFFPIISFQQTYFFHSISGLLFIISLRFLCRFDFAASFALLFACCHLLSCFRVELSCQQYGWFVKKFTSTHTETTKQRYKHSARETSVFFCAGQKADLCWLFAGCCCRFFSP